ncbi:MAG: FAD-dependent oxidoreductase, partial [Dehalococcoidia bacterium]|nr:FAD-dependent oxidoreductase [Dehalococcoidia bacterium]
AEAYQAQSDDEFLEGVLAELDEVFNGAASRFYVRHVVQNWNDEPFAGAAYLEDDAPPRISASVARPVSDRVQFAGDAYTEFADWSSVHAAIRSAVDTVQRMLS